MVKDNGIIYVEKRLPRKLKKKLQSICYVIIYTNRY